MKISNLFCLLLCLPLWPACDLGSIDPEPATIFGFWRYRQGVMVEMDGLEPGVAPLAYIILNEDETMRGMTSRNILGGTYRYDSQGVIKLDFNPLTRVHDTPWSTKFQSMLAAADSYRLEEDQLVLINSATNEELEFLRMSSEICSPIINKRRLYDEAESDPFRIKEVLVAGSCLEVTIEYGGGCGEAEVLLIGSGEYMESLPVQTNVKLLFKDHDPCEALVRRSFYFDLDTVLPPGETAIILHLEAWEQEIHYQ